MEEMTLKTLLPSLRRDLEAYVTTCEQKELQESLASREPVLCRPLSSRTRYHFDSSDNHGKVEGSSEEKDYQIEISLKSNREVLLSLLTHHKKVLLQEFNSLNNARNSREAYTFLKEMQDLKDDFRVVMVLIDEVLMNGDFQILSRTNEDRIPKTDKRGVDLIGHSLNEMSKGVKKFLFMAKLVEQSVKQEQCLHPKNHIHAKINGTSVIMFFKARSKRSSELERPQQNPVDNGSSSKSITSKTESGHSKVIMQKMNLLEGRRSHSQMILNHLITSKRLKSTIDDGSSFRSALMEPLLYKMGTGTEAQWGDGNRVQPTRLNEDSNYCCCFDKAEIYTPSVTSLPHDVSPSLQNKINQDFFIDENIYEASLNDLLELPNGLEHPLS